jgi:uncharacterized Ntn-hydrolase superfamily protein
MTARPSTFSIVAADPDAGEVGVAVQSKFLCVGAVVPWGRGGVGAVATQSFADVSFGPRGLDLLEVGHDPQAILDQLLVNDKDAALRQVGIIDIMGRAASYTGRECFPHANSVTGPNFACQGNIMATAEVVPSMARGFESASGPLAERLVEALRAAQRAGGDQRGQESAALLVVKPEGGYGGTSDRYIDLRVDHHTEPIQELARLLELHRFYFQRPEESDVLTADAKLEDEIGGLLKKLGKWESGQDMWVALESYMGWENLEERWVGAGKIDPKVLDYLRQDAG